MLLENVKLAYNDVSIIPAIISEISHRSECNTLLENGKLPIFTAPMSTVVNEQNFKLFEENHINAILPRNIDINTRLEYACNGKWSAFSLSEFQLYFTDEKFAEQTQTSKEIKALIDVANGHMKCIYDMVKESKRIFGKRIVIMIGNIANPKTYEEAYEAGVDFLRAGIGGGNGCFAKDTLVTMANGDKKPIQDVIEGEIVKTRGKDNVVLSRKEVEAKCSVRINNEIECTPNHKFFVINKEDKDIVNEGNLNDYGYFIEAENLDKTKHLLVKKY